MKPVFDTIADQFAAETSFCMRAVRELGAARRAGDANAAAEWLDELGLLSVRAESTAVRARAAREFAARASA